MRAIALALLTYANAASAHAQQVDTAAAAAALADFDAACLEEGGALWVATLCGPILLVDPGTRAAIANRADPAGRFARRGNVFVGTAPPAVPLANTSFPWNAERWSVVLLPLPGTSFDRRALLAHEAFHRVQPALALSRADALSPHLDTMEGRIRLRLELRALAAALQATDDSVARARTRDALSFRRQRYAEFPGADTLEAALEMQEGLAEYTGYRLAAMTTADSLQRVLRGLREFETRPSYVRALGYATGVPLGLLLDRFSAGWRTRLMSDPVRANTGGARARESLAEMLAQAIGFPLHAPAPVPAAAEISSFAPEGARAGVATPDAYGAAAIVAEETERASERRRRAADFRARLIDGPVLVLRQHSLMRSFDPNTLFPLADAGTVYPTGTFQGEWGELVVREGGALVSADFGELRVPAPSTLRTSPSGEVAAAGWSLRLHPGWRLERTAQGYLAVH